MIRIAYVDDNEVDLLVFTQLISNGVAKVDTFLDPLKFLRLIREQRTHYDFIFVDYQMPRLTGAELIILIQKHCPQSKIILVSGYSREDIENLIAKDRVHVYATLQKGMELEPYCRSIKEIICPQHGLV